MTLFEELGVEYKEVDGILYPLLSVDEAEYNLADIGKYGWMWLRYMGENEHSEYRHMARTGQLISASFLLSCATLYSVTDKSWLRPFFFSASCSLK